MEVNVDLEVITIRWSGRPLPEKRILPQVSEILPKAQRDQGLSASSTVTAFESYNKLIKIQLRNLDQISSFKNLDHLELVPTLP